MQSFTIGRADHDIPLRGSGTISIHEMSESKAIQDTGQDVTAIAVSSEVSAGQWVYVMQTGDEWQIVG